MLEIVKHTIEAHQMLTPGEAVLVALSGGADSTALLRALLLLGYPVRAFHLNHCLRGAEAERDEAFCRSLCARLQVPLTVSRADIRAESVQRGESIETAARHIRYERLFAAAGEGRIATAHTADDSVETVLFHLARGTGPEGLTGIPPVRGQLVRPLIETTRADVEDFLRQLGQDYVTDSTNADDRYTRNRIRHAVIPVLREINPALPDAVTRLSGLLRQDNAYLDGEAERLLCAARRASGKWQVDTLRSAHPALRSRAVKMLVKHSGVTMRDIAATHIQALERLLETDDPSAALSLPHGFTARREYDTVYITAAAAPALRREPVLLTVPFDRPVWGGTLHLSVRRLEKKQSFYKSFNTFLVDCGTICFDTFCVRARMPGDRLRLSKKGGSRTLKKLMIDRKIPRLQRDELAVLADKNGVIAVQNLGMDISRAPKGGALIEITIEE